MISAIRGASGVPRPLAAVACLLAAAPAAGGLRFAEVSASRGIDFRYHHGGSGQRYLVETVGGGVAIFDYDGDGDLDLYFVDGQGLPGYRGGEPRSLLLRNDGRRFADVTAAAGAAIDLYGNGAVAADVDGDGDLDLYLTAFGANRLLCNDGAGAFFDCTAEAGVGEPLWSASAAFADFDRDGDLDLYVTNYVDFTFENHRVCRRGGDHGGVVGYCQPEAYPSVPDTYYRNLGDGRFEVATAAAGLGSVEPRPGLGVVVSDLTGDGWPDLYVANDGVANYLFANRGDGTFEDASLLSGTAVSGFGEDEAGMGVDAGDYDGDGRFDLVVTNFEAESNGLYRNVGAGLFTDARFTANVAEPSVRMLGFGVELADLDNDGDPDLTVANGHVLDNAAEINPASSFAQRNQLFENRDGRFHEVAGAGLDVVRPSRGLATGDLDGDGDLELIIVNTGELAELWENLEGSRGGWLQVDLVAARSAPDGVGALLALEVDGGRLVDEVRCGSSYVSQSATTVHFGLGEATVADTLTVSWPSGARQRFERLPARHRLRVRE